MSFVERRLKPLPKTFAYEDEASPVRRTRSWTFSDYVPFEMGSADPEDSGAESIPVWPDTDDEEQMSMNFETYRKNTEQSFQSLQSTLEGSPRSESETGPTPTSIDLASALGDTPSTSASCTTSLRPAPVNVTLPILPHPVNCHSEMLLATNPQFSPVSCGARTAPATSPQSSPIGAPSFKLDGYGGPISPISDGRGSKSKDKQRSRPEPKSSGETTTLMIRNLPSHLTQTELLNELNKLGLSKLYDFCYLPRDFNVAENKGYAFVNFVSPETAHMFREQQSERERMHDMVREFAKLAVKGLSCQWLTMGGAPKSCSYSFDKALRRFTVNVEGEQPIELERVGVRKLQQVIEVKKDVLNTPFAKLLKLPPPHAVCGEHLKKRVVCLTYSSKLQEQEVLALLIPNQYDQERFYSCMKILRWALELEMKPRKSDAEC